MKLHDKVAVISGGNSGIGLAIAKLFHQEGAKISIMGRNSDTLASAAAELGPTALALQGDVTDSAALTRLFEATKEHHGGVDVLIVNAGISIAAPIEHTGEEIFDSLCNTNFKGLFFTVQKSLPYFNTTGTIILIGSAAWQKAAPNMSVYAATKAAVWSLTRSLAVELLPRGIRINLLSPGPVDTPIFDRLGLDSGQKQQLIDTLHEKVPINRLADPMEMARAALFLASDDSSYVIGSELVADGGWLIA